ncbi:hypothetical protein HOR19_gp49 [Phage MedPE-SWcel-C56]|uniref:Uncharacterized protein n=1 Tax=Phage MedPE-SWcel-C56 TaxID=1871314 RepID=A0A1B1IY35_9CAUD|nr:hypothetical protein HOR19_gp49 [Phage MedPE-SWcel-C56]ANS06242.1 hypothetical protein [Phage MedPE-SWcel-C56]
MTKATANPKVTANPALVDWPTDEYNFLQPLRSAILAAAGRVNGDKTKEEAFMATLSVGARHCKARATKMRDMKASAIDSALARERRDAEIEAQRTATEIDRREKELQSLKERAGVVDVKVEPAGDVA